MNKTKKINQLAIEAQKDTKALKEAGLSLNDEANYTEAMWFLLMEFDGTIRALEDKHGLKFNRTKNDNGSTAYERRLRKRLMECTLTYDGVRDFAGLVRRAFDRTTREFYKKYRGYARNERSYDDITSNESPDGDSQRLGYQIADENEDIEKRFETSEIIKALFEKYGHDEKRRYIMLRYIDEKDIETTALAREMMEKFGGAGFNGYRQFITRFRADMRSFIENCA